MGDAAPCQVAEVAQRDADSREAALRPELPNLVTQSAGQFRKFGKLLHLEVTTGIYFNRY